MSVLLLTATINSGYFGNISSTITDIKERRKQYHETLEKYIRYSEFPKIVFADNSEERLDESFFIELAKSLRKEIEFIELPGDKELMKKQGKSYGEAVLIKEAFEKSRLIGGESSFYKVTGRIWVENINKLINDVPETCFISHNFKSWVLTSFFKVRSDEFSSTLSVASKLCIDNTPNWFWCIEHVYYELLRTAIYPVNSFLEYPDMRGINSGSGGLYTKTRKQMMMRNLLLKLGIYHFHPDNQFYYPIFRWLESRM